MIPGVLGSGVSPSRGTINSVTQFQTSSIVNITWPASRNVFGGSGMMQMETSTDNSTWVPASIVSSNFVPLTGGTLNVTVAASATPLYYRVRQSLSGVLGVWSSSFLFNTALVTPPVAAPVSVTILSANHSFGDRYRVTFRVNQAAGAPAGTALGVIGRVRWGSGSPSTIEAYETVSPTGWLIGNTDYIIDVLASVISNPRFIVDIYNTAGGYDSDVVSSAEFPVALPPQSESFDFNTAGLHTVTIPAWATNWDYVIAGGGGGGQGTNIEIADSGTTAIMTLGFSGNPGAVESGSNQAMPIGTMFVTIGAGGGAGSGLPAGPPTNGGDTNIDITGLGVVDTAIGGTAGISANPGNVSFNSAGGSDTPLNVTISGVGTFVAGNSQSATWYNNTSGRTTGQNVCGGAGSGWATPLVSTEVDGDYPFLGAPGGAGFARITFKNF